MSDRESQLTPTILRHCIFECFRTSAREDRLFSRVSETILSLQVIKALQKDGFLETNVGWLKANLRIVENSAFISSYVLDLSKKQEHYEKFLPLINALSEKNAPDDVELIADVERLLYPAKVTDADLLFQFNLGGLKTYLIGN